MAVGSTSRTGSGMWWRSAAGAAMALVVAGLLIVASVKAQLVDPGEAIVPVTSVASPPPAIEAIRVDVDGQETDRAEIGHDIRVTAVVGPPRTAVSHLEFDWQPPVGDIIGSGRTVIWRIPKGTATPVSPVLTLTLAERVPDFMAGLVPAMREQRMSAEAPVIHVNDSRAELTRMSRAFLVDYFGNSSVSPEACLVDFSDTCKGKADELDDIRINRSKYLIRTAETHVSSIEFNASMNAAWITAPCEIHDIERATGRPHMMRADCLLTAVYDKPRWYLCDSHTANGVDGYVDERGRLLPKEP